MDHYCLGILAIRMRLFAVHNDFAFISHQVKILKDFPYLCLMAG